MSKHLLTALPLSLLLSINSLAQNGAESKVLTRVISEALHKTTHGSEWIINSNLLLANANLLNPTNRGWWIVHFSLKRGRN